MKKDSKLVSIIIPAFNEESGIVWLHDNLAKTLASIRGYTFEFIYINDGSTDKTQEILTGLTAPQNIKLTIIEFSRNFGKEAALSAGFAQCKGDAAISVDADGQYPIELIEKFIKKWHDGADVVIGVRGKNKNEGLVKKYGSRAYYSIFKQISEGEVVPNSTDFRLIDRRVIDEYNKLKENNRIARGLIDWLGFKRDYISFDANERKFGNAAYSPRKLVKLAMNSFVSLSVVPLYFSGYLGIIFMGLGFFGGLFVAIEQLILGDPLSLNITGTAILGILVMFLIGVVLAAQGLIGLYIARVLSEAQGRPLYVIREITKY